MQTDKFFNFRRFWLLLKNDFLGNYRSSLIAIGAVFGVLLFINVSSSSSSSDWDFHLVFYPLTLFIGGFIVTSMAFTELHHKQKSYAYVTLPASQFEKFLSKFLLTSIGYVLISAVLYYLYSLIAILISMPFFSRYHGAFDMFHPVIIKTMLIYLVTQSVFMFGAVYFKSHNFIKTILSLYALSLVLSLFSMLLARILFGDFFHGAPFSFSGMESVEFQYFAESTGRIIARVAEIFFWAFMAPLFWVLSYLRLSETEV